MIKRQFIFSLVLIANMYSLQTSAQDNKADEKVIELMSLKITHQVDLNQIFKVTSKLQKLQSDADNSNQVVDQPIPLELVGTLILGEKKFAWLKVADRVHQLETGQNIPGMQTQVKQINPDSILLDHTGRPCSKASCNSLSTVSITDRLF